MYSQICLFVRNLFIKLTPSEYIMLTIFLNSYISFFIFICFFKQCTIINALYNKPQTPFLEYKHLSNSNTVTDFAPVEVIALINQKSAEQKDTGWAHYFLMCNTRHLS